MITVIRHGVLESNTVDTVSVGVDADFIEVLNRGTDDIYFRFDGTDPEIDGNNSEIVPAGTALEVPRKASGNAVVKIISAGTPDYTVRGIVR
jgi:hypothetical protein